MANLLNKSTIELVDGLWTRKEPWALVQVHTKQWHRTDMEKKTENAARITPYQAQMEVAPPMTSHSHTGSSKIVGPRGGAKTDLFISQPKQAMESTISTSKLSGWKSTDSR